MVYWRCFYGDYDTIAGHCSVSCKAKYGNGDTLREVDNVYTIAKLSSYIFVFGFALIEMNHTK
ncbi:hypothetical protein ACO11K_002870 [Bacillus cytotoxicus]|uniref:hypothetical protein n=1 Tax=unclassified Bacillus cereus group TaxID=2750818 RepID=UPI001F57A47C|nr:MULTISPECIES: hypothetical protein [unclassified Bacillus cereus group]